MYIQYILQNFIFFICVVPFQSEAVRKSCDYHISTVLRCTSYNQSDIKHCWCLTVCLGFYSRSHQECIWQPTIIKNRIISSRTRGFTYDMSYCVWLRLCGCVTEVRGSNRETHSLLRAVWAVDYSHHNTMRYCRRKHMSLHLSPPTQISAVGKHTN